MDYVQCLELLAASGRELRKTRFDLATIQTVLAALGRPEQRYPTAIVAGTNGKGSTCAMLACILQTAGYRTGLYTSPHLVRVNERIQVNGELISDQDFAEAFTEVSEQVNRLCATGSLAHPPSFFEYLTATAFTHFAKAKAEFVVLEVGMGGRLDATNVTDPAVAAITNVELDHQEFLGRTHAEIAREKAGVIKPGRPVITACEHPAALEEIRRRCRVLEAELLEIDRVATFRGVEQEGGCYRFDLTVKDSPALHLRIPLAGRFQIRNAAVAAAAALLLARQGFHISPAAIEQGIEQARWPGRLETISPSPLIVLDGAHNPAAARELARFAAARWQGRRLRLVYASMRDKAIEEISSTLFPLAHEVFLTQCNVGRAATPEDILERSPVTAPSVVIERDPVCALELAVQRSGRDDVILVAGSLFLVGAIKAAMSEGRLTLAGQPAPAEVL